MDLTGRNGTHGAGYHRRVVPSIAARVSGRVTRKTDGAAIAGAIVTLSTPRELLTGRHAPQIECVRTDTDGRWSLTLHKPDRYEVSATAPGYASASRTRMHVSSSVKLDDIDFELAEGGVVIEGVVTSSDGDGLDGALVIARLEPARHKAFTAVADANGRYALSLAEGMYHLEAAYDDYASEWGRVTPTQGCVRNFSLVRGGVVRGRVVVRDTREPVAGAIVSGASIVVADENGAFEFRRLAAMEHRFSARAVGYATRTATHVLVRPGQVVESIELEVERAYSLSGRVVDKGGQGIADVFVVAARSRGPWNDSTSTDENGFFQIVGLNPGEYLLTAVNDTNQVQIDTPIAIRDQDVGDVVIEIDVGVTISGRVEPATVAVIGLQLAVEDGADLNQYTRAGKTRVATDATGAFTLEGIPNGNFEVVAATADGRFGLTPITVADVAQSGVVVTLTPRSRISGRVVDGNGKPVQNMQVYCRPLYRREPPKWSSWLNSPFARVATDGSFRFSSLDAGDYLITANHKDGAFVHVDGTTEARDVTVVLPARGAAITGRVVDASGRPVARVGVIAMREGGSPVPLAWDMGHATTDDAGYFTTGETPIGTYFITASYPTGGPTGICGGVTAGQDVTLTLQELGSLTIDVVQHGSRVPSVSILCVGLRSFVHEELINAVPPVTFERLPAAEYECDIKADGGGTKFKVTTRAGADTNMVVDLPAWSSLTGTVVHPMTNKPLANVHVSVRGDSSATTDADGRFVLERVPAGSDTAWFSPNRRDFRDFGADEHPFTATPGQRVDMGTINVVAPVSDAPGTLGLLVDDALVVIHLQTAGAAVRAGVVVGDSIVSIDGRDVAELTLPIAKRLFLDGVVSAGQRVRLRLARQVTIEVVAALLD